MEGDTFNPKSILIGFGILIGVAVGAYFLLRSMGIISHSTAPKNETVVAKPPEIPKPKVDVFTLTGADKVAYDALAKWVSVPITNQPTISKNPQTMQLPAGWTAREDYLLAVVPDKLPEDIKNYRTVIMRPSKTRSKSRDDAIFNVPDASNPYFKGHCHVGATFTTCYGGKDAETKAVFDLMFYFSK